MVERWQKSLGAHGVTESETVTRAELAASLRQRRGPLVLAFSDFVAEHFALEAFIEQAGTVDAGMLRTLSVEEQRALPRRGAGRRAGRARGGLSGVLSRTRESFIAALSAAVSPTVEATQVFEGYFAHVSDARPPRARAFACWSGCAGAPVAWSRST
ncbi:MAG: hypothetical protein QM756_17300 [Polyangiaceae bacterium]